MKRVQKSLRTLTGLPVWADSMAAAQAANDPEKINQATQAVTNAQTALNNANAAVKNTEAQLQACNNELTLASNGW